MVDAAKARTTDFGARAVAAVLSVGAVLTLGAALVDGAHTSLSVAAGGGAAALNLWVWGRIGNALLLGQGARSVTWVLVGFAKMAALFGGFYVLVISGITDILPLAVGYGALPIGIVLAQLGGSGTHREQ